MEGGASKIPERLRLVRLMFKAKLWNQSAFLNVAKGKLDRSAPIPSQVRSVEFVGEAIGSWLSFVEAAAI